MVNAMEVKMFPNHQDSIFTPKDIKVANEESEFFHKTRILNNPYSFIFKEIVL